MRPNFIWGRIVRATFPRIWNLNAKKYAVLYVDDNDANLRLVEGIMEQRTDVDLTCALSGQNGLSMARELLPDLVLLDLQMPDLSGDLVLKALKADAATREIPVVMVSADVNPAQTRKLLALGAEAYVTKPLNVREFHKLIDEKLLAIFEKQQLLGS